MNQIKLAILGLGSRSTAYYLTELNKVYNKVKGGYSTCPFVLFNTNFDHINPLLPNPSVDLDDIVENYLYQIEKHAPESILIPNITLHETIDRLNIKTNILHPIHLTIAQIKKNKWNKITLFGSIYSMQTEYIKSHFEANGIKVILPKEEDQLSIDQARKEIYSGSESKETIRAYHSLIDQHTALHPVILACTELSILKPKSEQVLDMADLQILAAVDCYN